MLKSTTHAFAVLVALSVLLAVGGTALSEYSYPTTDFFPELTSRIDLSPRAYDESCCIFVANDSSRQIVVQVNGSVHVRIVPEGHPNEPVFDSITSQVKQAIMLPRGVFVITARNEGEQTVVGSILIAVQATHVDYPYRNWGILARAYSPALVVSCAILILSTRIRGRTGLPLRFLLEWAIPAGAYFTLLSFLLFALSADALHFQLQDLDYYKALPYFAELTSSSSASPSSIQAFIATPFLMGVLVLLVLLRWSHQVALPKLALSHVPVRVKTWYFGRVIGALLAPGQLLIFGALIGILITSIAVIPGARTVFLPQPFSEFTRALLEREQPSTGSLTLAVFLFAFSAPIALALYLVEVLWHRTGRRLLGLLGSFGIGSLGFWIFLSSQRAATLLLIQLIGLPGLAINTLAFAVIYNLAERLIVRIPPGNK